MKKRRRIRTVKVLEIGQLDALAHAENVGGAAEAVESHPDVARVESRDLVVGNRARVAGKSMLNVGPCSNKRREDHQTKGEEGKGCHAAAEPEDFAVGNEDDGQVFEDGVDGDG
jgi:hypothetical protein